ncbi:hypothetical protein, partial [Ilumatobacter nonamiensis]|uniref:hypothetical protein n=1 Tax=Ilumatobacter nonamiensis TaxID=467093 RepID=UPI00058CF4D3
MISMVRRLALGLLASSLLTVLLVVSAPGAAQAFPRLFWLHNVTPYTLQIAKFQNNVPEYSHLEAPRPGTILEPGQMLEFRLDEMRLSASDGPHVDYHFDVLDDNDASFGSFWASMFWGPSYGRSSRGEFTARPSGMTLEFADQDIYIYDKKGEVDISKLSVDRQADFVGNMCDSDRATCLYSETGARKPASSEERDLIAPVENFTCAEIKKDLKMDDKRTLENAWGVEVWAKGGVKGSFEAGIKLKYSGKYVTSSSFEQSTGFEVPPRYRGRWLSTVPAWRYTGDYSIVASDGPGTVWTIKGVTVDTPHPDGFTAQQTRGAPILPSSRAVVEKIDPTTMGSRKFPDCPSHLDAAPAPDTVDIEPESAEPDQVTPGDAEPPATTATTEQPDVGEDDTP